MNSFTYGVSDNFYLMVSTLKYKQDSTSVDLKKSLEVNTDIRITGQKYDCETRRF
jgi:hypothetical protein